MAYKEVEWLFQRDVEETYNITVGGEVITTTDEHPFWIVGKGWVEAQYLALGDVLTTSDGKELAIEKIVVKEEHITVYNFKVKDFHTYFVSNLGIWTHNKCGFLTPQQMNKYKSEVLSDNDIHFSTKEQAEELNVLEEDFKGNSLEQSDIYKQYEECLQSGRDNALFQMAYRVKSDMVVKITQHIVIHRVVTNINVNGENLVPWYYVDSKFYVADTWWEEDEDVLKDLSTMSLFDFFEKYKAHSLR